jgi:hypothetical protein
MRPSPAGAEAQVSTDERRRLERLPVIGIVPGEVRIVHPIKLVELSEGGASLELSQPLVIESLHDFRIELGDNIIIVKGRVAHSRVADVEQGRVAYRAGIEFIDLPAHVREALYDYIVGLKRKA